MALREWVKENVGLLDDERYIDLSDHLLASWEILMKITARLPGERFKDREQMITQLRRYGRSKPKEAVEGLDRAGWIVDAEGGGVQMRGWAKYQFVYRGPSDDPEAKRVRNAARPTSDPARREEAAARKDAQKKAQDDMRANASGGSLKAALAAAGLNPAIADPGLDTPRRARVD